MAGRRVWCEKTPLECSFTPTAGVLHRDGYILRAMLQQPKFQFQLLLQREQVTWKMNGPKQYID